jgi:hypothetical protein
MNRERAKELLPIIQAFAEGKVIEGNFTAGEENSGWHDLHMEIDFSRPNWKYRTKPLEFPPLPEGLEWHLPKNLTPKEYEVDKGWRPAVKGEMQTPGYEYFTAGNWEPGRNYDYAADVLNKECPVRIPISTPFPEPPKKVVRVPLEPSDLPAFFWIRGNFEQWLCTGRCWENKRVDFAGQWKSLKACQEEGWEMSETPQIPDSWVPMWK